MKMNKKYAPLSFVTALAVMGMSLGSLGFAQTVPVSCSPSISTVSANQAATCSVTVVAATSGSLVCSPAVQNVTLGQTASVSATGGTGTYVWSAPDLTIINPNGSGFSASYASAGLKTLTVTSGAVGSACPVNVLAGVYVPPVPPVTPGLPETGGGDGK